jgi:hypothetical protein
MSFQIELNRWPLLTLESKPSNKVKWTTLGFRIPNIELPFYTQNQFGEWEKTFNISLPTTIQITHTSDMSLEFYFIILGFGFAFCYQYGY